MNNCLTSVKCHTGQIFTHRITSYRAAELKKILPKSFTEMSESRHQIAAQILARLRAVWFANRENVRRSRSNRLRKCAQSPHSIILMISSEVRRKTETDDDWRKIADSLRLLENHFHFKRVHDHHARQERSKCVMTFANRWSIPRERHLRGQRRYH